MCCFDPMKKSVIGRATYPSRNYAACFADVNGVDVDGDSVSLRSSQSQYRKVMQMLIDAEADVNDEGHLHKTVSTAINALGLLLRAGATDLPGAMTRYWTIAIWSRPRALCCSDRRRPPNRN